MKTIEEMKVKTLNIFFELFKIELNCKQTSVEVVF